MLARFKHWIAHAFGWNEGRVEHWTDSNGRWMVGFRCSCGKLRHEFEIPKNGYKMELTWGEWKKSVEEQNLKDSDLISFIDIDGEQVPIVKRAKDGSVSITGKYPRDVDEE